MWFTSIKVKTETKRGGSLELSRFFVLRRRIMKTKLIMFLASLTFMSLFSISSALFADEFSEFESVVKSVKMACFYEIQVRQGWRC
jgi:hypothetical protein